MRGSGSIHARCSGSSRLLLGTLALAGCASGATRMQSGGEVIDTPVASRTSVSAVVASWPEKPRETVAMLTAKYGQPTVVGDRMVVWYGTGQFVKTSVARDEAPHAFPMPHTDYLTQTVKHRVPPTSSRR